MGVFVRIYKTNIPVCNFNFISIIPTKAYY